MIKRLLKKAAGKWAAPGKAIKKVEAIRQRERFLGKPRSEPLRESKAREFVARTVILPGAKKFFGKNLLAAMIVGSSQQGVRQATRKRIESDLDLKIILNRVDDSKAERFAEKMCRLVRRKFGFNISMFISDEELFVDDEREGKEPFQVIYGKAAVDRLLAGIKIRGRKMPPKQKYGD